MNRRYPSGSEGILDGSIKLTGDVRVMLLRTGADMMPNHRFLSSVATFSNGRSGPLTGKKFTGGVFDADNTLIKAHAAVRCNAYVLYQHTGDDATARLIAVIDDFEEGMPFTPAAGQEAEVIWSDGRDKIFRL